MKLLETLKSFGSEAPHGGSDLFKSLALFATRFGEEFVGIAHQSLEQRRRHVVARRQWQFSAGNVIGGKSGAGVCGGHAHNFVGGTFGPQQFGA